MFCFHTNVLPARRHPVCHGVKQIRQSRNQIRTRPELLNAFLRLSGFGCGSAALGSSAVSSRLLCLCCANGDFWLPGAGLPLCAIRVIRGSLNSNLSTADALSVTTV